MPDYTQLMSIDPNLPAAPAPEKEATETVLMKNNDNDGEEIAVVSNTAIASVIHKKRRFVEEDRKDPVAELPPQALAIVFSFLGKEKNHSNTDDSRGTAAPLICFREAGRLYWSLASVSHSWRDALDESFYAALNGHALDVNLQKIHTASVFSSISWVAKLKLSIGSLEFEAYQSDFGLLDLIIRRCDTQELTKVKAVTFPYYQSPHWVPQDEVYAEFLRREPFMTDRDLQYLLATECPNLSDLSIRLSIRGEDYDKDLECVSPKLFSMESIARLNLSFSSPMVYDDLDGLFVDDLIRRLTGLKELILVDHHGSPFRCRADRNHRYEEAKITLHSCSLETLDVTNYRRMTSFSCDCPNLKRFLCKGKLPINNWERVLRPLMLQKLLDDGNAPLVQFVNVKNVQVLNPYHRRRFANNHREGFTMSRAEMDNAFFATRDEFDI